MILDTAECNGLNCTEDGFDECDEIQLFMNGLAIPRSLLNALPEYLSAPKGIINCIALFCIISEPLKRFRRKWKCNFLVRWPNTIRWCSVLSFFQRNKLSAMGLPWQWCKGFNYYNYNSFIPYWFILLRKCLIYLDVYGKTVTGPLYNIIYICISGTRSLFKKLTF